MTAQERALTYRIVALFAVLILVGSLSGCATLQQQIQQPTVRLANVAFLEGGLAQQVYGVTLEVDNPNGIALPIKALNYNLRLAGKDFASGLNRGGFSIPARGSEQVQLEVRTNLIDSISHLSRLLAGGMTELDYEISGDIEIGLPLVGPIPFSQSGQIALTRAANADAI